MQTEEIYSPHVNQKCISILNIFGMAVELKEKYEFAFNIKKEGYQNSGEPGENGRTSKEKKKKRKQELRVKGKRSEPENCKGEVK